MPLTIAPTAVVHPGAELADGAVVEDFAIVGVAPAADPVPELRIGPGARIRSHTVVYAGSRIGARFQTGHGAMIREANTIGDDVSVGTHSIVEHHVRLGNRVRIHSNAFVPEYTEVEDGAWIGPSVTFTNALYPLSPDAKANLRGPIIRAGAKIGANATLLPGIVVGRDALVGAGSVVVRDVPDGAVVVGNPARVVRHVREIDAYRETPTARSERP
jgi:acetyltransferase-like isoleucine patch superfamily enzyme